MSRSAVRCPHAARTVPHQHRRLRHRPERRGPHRPGRRRCGVGERVDRRALRPARPARAGVARRGRPPRARPVRGARPPRGSHPHAAPRHGRHGRALAPSSGAGQAGGVARPGVRRPSPVRHRGGLPRARVRGLGRAAGPSGSPHRRSAGRHAGRVGRRRPVPRGGRLVLGGAGRTAAVAPRRTAPARRRLRRLVVPTGGDPGSRLVRVRPLPRRDRRGAARPARRPHQVRATRTPR